MSEGIRRIAAERERQMAEEKRTPEHDDRHRSGELAVEAAALAVFSTDAYVVDPDGWHGSMNVHDDEGDCWGLQAKHGKDKVRALEIAGALIAAELDRILRAALRAEVERRGAAMETLAEAFCEEGDKHDTESSHCFQSGDVSGRLVATAKAVAWYAAGDRLRAALAEEPEGEG